MPTKPAEVIGVLKGIRKGSMNPINTNTGPNSFFSAADDTITIVQKLNSTINLDQYGTLNGIVVSVDSTNKGFYGGLLKMLGTSTDDNSSISTAYVFIDVLHSAYSSLLDPTNYRNYLTEVQVFDEMKLAIGEQIQVSFASTDYSKGVFIKKLKMPIPSAPLTAYVNNFARLCNAPKASPTTASPSSTPFNFSQENVGYFQALYALAAWQTKYPGIKISSIKYPFVQTNPNASLISVAITELLKKVQNSNQKVLQNLKQNSNPSKQWVLLVAKLLLFARYEASADPRMLVTVESSTPLKPALARLKDFSKNYVVQKSASDSSFYFSFGRSGMTTTAAIALTKQNLGDFLNSFEKSFVGQGEPSKPTPPPPEVTAADSCISTENYKNYPSELAGVPFVSAGFTSARKRKRTHLIVMHHSVTSTAAATNYVLRQKRCSVHFNIDRGKRAGVQEQHLPLDIRAAHAGRLNPFSIAVENTNPTGPWSSSYKPDQSKVYEGCYQLLKKLTKATKIPFWIHEANVTPGYFFFGKFTNNEHFRPGIMAHGSDLGTTHEDGKFELLYCHLRHIGQDEETAYSNSVAMLATAKQIKKRSPLTPLCTKYKNTPENVKLNRVGQYIKAYYKIATVKILT